jgi:hypothetical protein
MRHTQPNKPLTPRQQQILRAARVIAADNGHKTTDISHLYEKLGGERFLTWRDLDEIQRRINLPHLLEMWLSALCGMRVFPASSVRPNHSSHPARQAAFYDDGGDAA